MKLVLDASVALSWLRLPSQTCSEQAFTILDDLNGEAVLVPQIWPMEVAQGTLRVERQQQATAAILAKFSAVLNSVPVVNESRPSTAWLPQCERLAREHGLTVYDASYLELALWRGAVLATFDKRLARAAQASGVLVVGHEPVTKLEEPFVRYGGRHCLAGLALTSPRTSSGMPAPPRGARRTRRRPAAAP
ncbi:type II toxin-antitoxin system VapC family toxin [Achromobacter ruhlandii]|uniref:type II toxin-antitoxin system VapC family toxin n=1 Tax=Achromobacter ruhlandii TaxID=72557 RepID=UPI0009EAC185|nr:type II toxin-antitoxin system VapC family toxin [Achromobacter ruhlandii]AVC42572.1 PIN domain-containing protein [Achromobacter xylosoxidans]